MPSAALLPLVYRRIASPCLLQAELDKLNLTLVEVEKYTDDMRGEIAITRRATYKAEEDISKLEQGKKQQARERRARASPRRALTATRAQPMPRLTYFPHPRDGALCCAARRASRPRSIATCSCVRRI